MAAEPLYNFVVVRGNCLPISVTFRAAGVAVDLTGYLGARLTVRPPEASPLVLDAPARLTLGGVAGTITGELTAAESQALPIGRVTKYELRLVEPDGCLKTILKGFVDVRYSAIEG